MNKINNYKCKIFLKYVKFFLNQLYIIEKLEDIKYEKVQKYIKKFFDDITPFEI